MKLSALFSRKRAVIDVLAAVACLHSQLTSCGYHIIWKPERQTAHFLILPLDPDHRDIKNRSCNLLGLGNASIVVCLCFDWQALSAHFLWLSYLMETWAVVSRLRDSRTAAARTVYGRLLAASLQNPCVLSHHPAAVGAYFRLLTLGLQYGKSCLRSAASGAAGRAGIAAGADILLLFDRILQAVSGLRVQQLLSLSHCAVGSKRSLVT